MARKKKQQQGLGVWLALGAVTFGIYQFGLLGHEGSSTTGGSRTAPPVVSTSAPSSAVEPLNKPRFVNVASLNVRHTPSTSGPLVTALPRGTVLKVMGREGGWLLVDLGPTLEGWVAEHLTTTQSPKPDFRPPARVTGVR